MLDEVRNVVELTSIWAERTRGVVHGGGGIYPDSTNGLLQFRASPVPRFSGENQEARLRIWVILTAIHVKVGWVRPVRLDS